LPSTWESFKVKGEEVLARVKEILREGNVRHVVVKQGARTIAEFPVTFGVLGVLAAPGLAALGAAAALLSDCTIEVEREASATSPPRRPSPSRRARKA